MTDKEYDEAIGALTPHRAVDTRLLMEAFRRVRDMHHSETSKALLVLFYATGKLQGSGG